MDAQTLQFINEKRKRFFLFKLRKANVQGFNFWMLYAKNETSQKFFIKISREFRRINNEKEMHQKTQCARYSCFILYSFVPLGEKRMYPKLATYRAFKASSKLQFE